MDFINRWFLHLNETLPEIVNQYQGWTYAILFAVIFAETGLVVTPFLPGDSLLFAAGALTVEGKGLSFWPLCIGLTIAAIIGDTVNYHIGAYLGPKVLSGKLSRWLNPKHLEQTHLFFEKYGAKTIVIARFIPIVRTFAPFVAGVGTMSYGRFLVYNVAGGILWVFSFVVAGHYFANLPFVKERFHFVILGIIVVSVLPAVIEAVRWRLSKRARHPPHRSG